MADSTYKIVTSSKPRISLVMSHFLDMPNPGVTCHLAHNTGSWKKGHNVHLGGIAIEGGCVRQPRPVTGACQRVDSHARPRVLEQADALLESGTL